MDMTTMPTTIENHQLISNAAAQVAIMLTKRPTHSINENCYKMPDQKKNPAIILNVRRKTKLSQCNQQVYQILERYLKNLQGGSFYYQTSLHNS